MSPRFNLGINPADVKLAKTLANVYRSKGYSPLPSRIDAKRPYCKFRQYFDSTAPASLFDRWPSSNIQLITGRFHRLLVIDLDGEAAKDWFYTLGKPIPDTWVTHSGGDGEHLWFTIPQNWPTPLRKEWLWRDGNDHSGVERLCDGSLITVPPSIHVKTGNRYRFADKLRSPAWIAMPALCPRWILDLPPVRPPRPTPAIIIPSSAEPYSPGMGMYRARDVLAAIPDKIALAASWGVRFDGSPSRAGWHPCHAIDRPDIKASAAVNETSGYYVDLGSGLKLGLFDLAVAMGKSSDWRDAMSSLGDEFITRGIG